MEPSVAIFGPLDTMLGPYMEYVLLVLLLANIAARKIEYETIVQQATQGGAEAISRHPFRVWTNVLLVLASFYYLTLHHHSGIVVSMMTVGLLLTDLFEFEARKVEARREIEIEPPKGAMAASVLALLYIGYISLFFLIKPFWSAVV